MTCHLQHFEIDGKRIGRRIAEDSDAIVWEPCDPCPIPNTDACTSDAPCPSCPRAELVDLAGEHCPWCRDTWAAHVVGNPCSTLRTGTRPSVPSEASQPYPSEGAA